MLRLITALVVLLGATPAAAALNCFWDGDGPDPNITTVANWLNDYYPLNNGNFYLRFGYSAETGPVVDVPFHVAGLNFDEAIGSFTLSGQPLSINDLGITADGLANFHTQTITADVLLTANQTWHLQNNPLTVTGDVELQNRVLGITGAKGVTLAGNVNLGFIDVLPGGKLTLSGVVTCDIDNQGGTLIVATDQPQFPGSNLQFSGASTLGATGVHQTGVSLDTSGELTFVGPGAMSAANGIRGSGSLVVDAPAFGAQLVLGPGYFTPFAGAVTIRAGRLDLDGAQPGVPALTGPITLGDGVGPAGEAVLALSEPGIVDMNLTWLPIIAADGKLELGGDHQVTEFRLNGGTFSCNGVFETEYVQANASNRTAVIEGTWATPASGDIVLLQMADGSADPDVRLTGEKRGPGRLAIVGPGHAEMTGPASAQSGGLLADSATLTLGRENMGQAMNLASFAAAACAINCTRDEQFGPNCDLDLLGSTLDLGEGLVHDVADVGLQGAAVTGPLGELRVHGALEVLSTSSTEGRITFMAPVADLTIATGDTLFGDRFHGQTVNLNGQGYVFCEGMTGDVDVWDPTLVSAGAFTDLFVQSHLNVPLDTGDNVLNVDQVLTLHADSDVTLTLRNAAEYSRIEVSAGLSGTGIANLDGYLEIALAPDVDVQPGDEFVLVRAGTINGAFAAVVPEYTPTPDQTWSVFMTSDGFNDELRLRLDGPSAVGDTPSGLVTALDLRAAPNPFNPRTTVAFDLPQDGPAVIDVVDVRGRVVTRLVDGDLPRGRHEVAFTGRDRSGRALPSGVYFVRLQARGGSLIRKVTLVQ